MTRWFARYARREGLSAQALRECVDRAARGLIDAELGGGLIKQRVARTGEGLSGGYRTLIAFRMKDRSIFMYGFAKNERDNITSAELKELKRAATVYLALSEHDLAGALSSRKLLELE